MLAFSVQVWMKTDGLSICQVVSQPTHFKFDMRHGAIHHRGEQDWSLLSGFIRVYSVRFLPVRTPLTETPGSVWPSRSARRSIKASGK